MRSRRSVPGANNVARDQRLYPANRPHLMLEKGGRSILIGAQSSIGGRFLVGSQPHNGTVCFSHSFDFQEMRQVQEVWQDDEPPTAFGWCHRHGQCRTVDASIGNYYAPIDSWTGAAAGSWQPPIALTLMKEQQP